MHWRCAPTKKNTRRSQSARDASHPLSNQYDLWPRRDATLYRQPGVSTPEASEARGRKPHDGQALGTSPSWRHWRCAPTEKTVPGRIPSRQITDAVASTGQPHHHWPSKRHTYTTTRGFNPGGKRSIAGESPTKVKSERSKLNDGESGVQSDNRRIERCTRATRQRCHLTPFTSHPRMFPRQKHSGTSLSGIFLFQLQMPD